MEFQLDSPVISEDGADLGKINRVIFDPQSAEVKSIIIEKGIFFTHDVAVPIEDVRAAAPGKVVLSLTREEFGRWEEALRAWSDLLEAELGDIGWDRTSAWAARE